MADPYDISEARAKLNDYLKEISDLLTSQEDLDNYAAFNGALYNINALTEAYYKPQPDGSFLPLDEEHKRILQDAYQQAIDQAALLIPEGETGPGGLQMRGIVRELTPMLQSDLAALSMVDVSKEPMPLPQIIGKARQQAVDLGDQQAPTVGGSINTRQHIQVVNNGVSEPGFFTPTVTVDPEGEYRRHLDRMEAKYPAYRPIIDAMRTKEVRQVCNFNWIQNYHLVDPALPIEEQQKQVRDRWNEQPLSILDIDAGDLQDRPDFLMFMDELGRGMDPVVKQFRSYKDGAFSIPDGANVDRRNIAMSRVSAMAGKKGLVAEARPMMLIQNGTAVSGTFMEEAYGFNLSNVEQNDPVAGFGDDNFNNPAVMGDVAAAQALDFICGNVDRNPYNFFLRFDPKSGPNARLTGITLIDNDLSFPEQSLDELPKGMLPTPDEMGVIGEDFYNWMKSLTTIDQFQAAFADCGLSPMQIQRAWERKEVLQKQAEEDIKYFEDKPAGYTEKGHVRIVPAHQWGQYRMSDLAAKHNRSMFKKITDMPASVQNELSVKEVRKETIRDREESRRRILGLAPLPQAAPQADIPAATVVGNGLQQDQGPAIAPQEDVLKLAVPPLSNMNTVGGQSNQRYPITWTENGEEKRGFFTPADELSLKQGISQIFDQYADKYPQYADALHKMKNYYNAGTVDELASFPDEPTKEELKEMGFSRKESDDLLVDRRFITMQNNLKADLYKYGAKVQSNNMYGINPGEKNRVDIRNVSMTDVSDVLGMPNATARSRVVQVDAGGKLIDGVVMEEANGLDIDRIRPGDPAATIPKDKFAKTFDNPDSIASVADLQILDYICLNVDRNPNNMFYRFSGLDTGDPKFLGVQAIDNDYSLGTMVPDPEQMTKALPAVKDLDIITEERAKEINDPKAPEKLAEKLRKRGHTEEEINAAIARMEQIKAGVKDGTIRTVRKEELGKEPYTFEKLSKRSNYFSTIKYQFIDKMKNMSDSYYALPEDRRPVPGADPGLNYSKVIKVDELGPGLQKNKEFEKLSKEAERQFINGIAKTAKNAAAPEVRTEKEMMDALVRESEEMYAQLHSADPKLHGTSRKYKNLKGACKDLGKIAKKLGKKLKGPNDTLSNKDRYKIVQQINKIRDCSTDYDAKKEAERQRGKEPSLVGEARLEQSSNVRGRSRVLMRTYHKTLAQTMSKDSALKYAHDMIKASQINTGKHTGEDLKNDLADLLYYKALTKLDYGSKRGKALKNAVDPDVAQTNRELIKGSPAFKRLSQMPEDELKALASKGGGDELLDRYITETAKDVQSEQAKQTRQQELNKIKQPEPVNNGPAA